MPSVHMGRRYRWRFGQNDDDKGAEGREEVEDIRRYVRIPVPRHCELLQVEHSGHYTPSPDERLQLCRLCEPQMREVRKIRLREWRIHVEVEPVAVAGEQH